MLPSKSKWQSIFETLAIAGYLFSALGLCPLTVAIMILLYLHSTIGQILVISYCVWIFLDRHTHETGGRRFEWFRNLSWWRYHRSYFPINLHKTSDLPGNKNYLMVVFPHGVLSSGCFSSFGTNVTTFSQLFPDLKAYLCTLRILFFLPGIRELMLLGGLISPTPKSLNYVLSGRGDGRAVVLVAGGAAEALHNRPGTYKTILPQRKGFCKIALRNGVPLVPVIAFGEVDLFEVTVFEPGSIWHKMQQWVKDISGVLPVIFSGDGFFKIMPKRQPINVVVGSPIHVEANQNITEEDVNNLHAKFTEAITALFEAEKPKYLKNSNVQLELVQ